MGYMCAHNRAHVLAHAHSHVCMSGVHTAVCVYRAQKAASGSERSKALCTPRCSKRKVLLPSPPARWPSGLNSVPVAPRASVPGHLYCSQSFPPSLQLLKLSWPTLGSLTGSQRGQIRTCPGLPGSVYLPLQPASALQAWQGLPTASSPPHPGATRPRPFTVCGRKAVAGGESEASSGPSPPGTPSLGLGEGVGWAQP